MHTTEFQYLQSKQNSQLFLAHYSPCESSQAKEHSQAVVLVPPFAEELNRSKRMYVLCARLLANAGIHALIFDYSGSGDSSGEWGEFSYTHWMSDLHDVYQYSRQVAKQVNFIALRFGALILADTLVEYDLAAHKCLLWDPIEKGDALTRQLVRMKIAAAMTDSEKKITTQDVIQSMQQQGYLESAGYHITQSMFEDINKKSLESNISTILNVTNVHWMSSMKASASGSAWTANSFKQDDLSSDQLARLVMYSIGDVKFWMQQEVTIAHRMLQHTYKVLIDE